MYTPPAELQDHHASKIVLYRTSVAFHSMNPEKPFFYIDGQQFAKLGTGELVTIRVVPSNHTLTVRESIAFMPGRQSEKLEYVFEAGQTYYVRYSKEFSHATVIGGNVLMSGTNSFGIVSEELFKNKK